MNNKNPIWVVTDVDGTLMDHNYDLTPALETISLLKKKKIPLIPCTSKTSAEVRHLRNQIGINDPFIVENGGAIYGNKKDSQDEWKIILGKSFNELRLSLDLISKELSYKLTALNDLNYKQIQELTGLKGDSISKAIAREWSVPFLTPPKPYIEKMNQIANKNHLNIYQGNRMSHLLGNGSHKGKALKELKIFMNEPNANVIALGDSPNDIPLLEVAEIAVVVPGPTGPHSCFLQGIEKGDYLLAPYSHSEGWASIVSDLIK